MRETPRYFPRLGDSLNPDIERSVLLILLSTFLENKILVFVVPTC